MDFNLDFEGPLKIGVMMKAGDRMQSQPAQHPQCCPCPTLTHLCVEIPDVKTTGCRNSCAGWCGGSHGDGTAAAQTAPVPATPSARPDIGQPTRHRWGVSSLPLPPPMLSGF